MTLSLPPSPAQMQLPPQNVSTVETTSYYDDATRVDASGNTRVTVAGDTRTVWVENMVYAIVIGQTPNMSRRMSLPE